MRRILNWVFAALLICAASVLASCSNDDSPVTPDDEIVYPDVPLVILDTDIIFDPMETGNSIEYLPEQVIADVSWTDAHPIKQVYMQCDCDTGQKMWDPLTVINAVEGDDLFSLTERGTVVLNDEGAVIFTPSPTGNSRFQKPGDAAWNAAMLEKIRTYNQMR